MALRTSATRLLVVLLLSALLPSTLFARWYKDQRYPLKVQILSSEFIPQDPTAEFPAGCDLKHYSEACDTGGTPAGISVIHLVDSWNREYTLTCKADAHWSKCSPLPEKAYFKGRRHGKGFTIVYPDPTGKEQPHFYPYSKAPAKAAKAHSAAKSAEAEAANQPEAETQDDASETSAAASAGTSDQTQPEAIVRCHIASTPDGAEITIDGHYVGNTPSAIGLAPGEHAVVISMPGYGDWRRELHVTPESSVNITAHLQPSGR